MEYLYRLVIFGADMRIQDLDEANLLTDPQKAGPIMQRAQSSAELEARLDEWKANNVAEFLKRSKGEVNCSNGARRFPWGTKLFDVDGAIDVALQDLEKAKADDGGKEIPDGQVRGRIEQPPELTEQSRPAKRSIRNRTSDPREGQGQC